MTERGDVVRRDKNHRTVGRAGVSPRLFVTRIASNFAAAGPRLTAGRATSCESMMTVPGRIPPRRYRHRFWLFAYQHPAGAPLLCATMHAVRCTGWR